MAEIASLANAIQEDYRTVPTVPEDVASPDGSRTYPDGPLTSSTAHNRAEYPQHPSRTDALQDLQANKKMSNQSQTTMGAHNQAAERRSSTATTATMMSGAASLAGKSVECPGCKKMIDQASGGVVVAVG
jgi:hypothetical protein